MPETAARRWGSVMGTQRTAKGMGRPDGRHKSGHSSRIHSVRRWTLKILSAALVVGSCGAFPPYTAHGCGATESSALFLRTEPVQALLLPTDPSGDLFQPFSGRARATAVGLTDPPLHVSRPFPASAFFKTALPGCRSLVFLLCGMFSPRAPPSGNGC
jgi:hypothetical protein